MKKKTVKKKSLVKSTKAKSTATPGRKKASANDGDTLASKPIRIRSAVEAPKRLRKYAGRPGFTEVQQQFCLDQAEMLRAAYNAWRERENKQVYDLKKYGIGLPSFYAYINARSCPSTVMLAQLAKTFGVPSGSLMPDMK